MDIESIRKRQLRTLQQLADAVDYRRDRTVPLAQFAPTLRFSRNAMRFLDVDQPIDDSSDLAYDLNCLLEEGAIRTVVSNVLLDNTGELLTEPAIGVTADGMQTLSEETASSIRKAIDKQPMTFLQIILTILLALGSMIGGCIVGRYQGGAAEPPSNHVDHDGP